MSKEKIKTRFWEESAEPHDPFSARHYYCGGYDVFGDLLLHAKWFEYLYLLFKGELPHGWKTVLLEKLAIALANPGPRDLSVSAAMNGGVGGSTSASCLMAALATGAGLNGGASELQICMKAWRDNGCDRTRWIEFLRHPNRDRHENIWGELEHPPGFSPHATDTSLPVRQLLELLARKSEGSALSFLLASENDFRTEFDRGLSICGVAAAALHDLDFSPEQGEIIYLMLRLPGAAVHALEQRTFGWKEFPFFKNGLILDEEKSDATTESDYHANKIIGNAMR